MFEFSPEGECILVGGQSVHVALYSVPAQLLLRKFTLTVNYSLDAVAGEADPRRQSEFGPSIESGDEEEGKALKLAGVRSGDASERRHRPEARTGGLGWSPTGRAWAAATAEGILVYSLDAALLFDPFQLSAGVTPAAVRAKVTEAKLVGGLEERWIGGERGGARGGPLDGPQAQPEQPRSRGLPADPCRQRFLY